MASFQAKMGRDKQSVIQKKKVVALIHSNPTRNREFQKNSKDMQKIKKHHCGIISSQNGMGQTENDTKKMLSFQSIPTQPRIGDSRKIAKKFKLVKKHHYGLISSHNVTGQGENESK